MSFESMKLILQIVLQRLWNHRGSRATISQAQAPDRHRVADKIQEQEDWCFKRSLG